MSDAAPAGCVVSVQRLSVALGGRDVLRDVSFRLGAGQLCGLIGANGSGKTTLLRAIAGFQRPGAGRVAFGAGGASSIGYVPQKIALDPWLPLRARDVVSLGLDGHRLGLPWPSARRRRAVDAMLAAVDARPFAEQRVGSLSGGQQQRVLIAHALIRHPALLLLDEPLASLDMRSAASIVALLRRLCSEFKVGVLMSAHDMNPLLASVDGIVYLAHGRAASGSAQDVVRTEVLSMLYGYPIDVIRAQGRVLVVAAGEDEGDARHAARGERMSIAHAG